MIGSLLFVSDISKEGRVRASSTSQSQHKMESRFSKNTIIAQCAAILKLFSRKDESLLIRRDAFTILNCALYILNEVPSVYDNLNSFTCKRLDIDFEAKIRSLTDDDATILETNFFKGLLAFDFVALVA